MFKRLSLTMQTPQMTKTMYKLQRPGGWGGEREGGCTSTKVPIVIYILVDILNITNDAIIYASEAVVVWH